MNLSKLVLLGIWLFCCSTPLYGMMQSMTNEVIFMTDINEIDEYLKNNIAPSAIATAALCHLHRDSSVSREKVDILVKYAGQRELAYVFSIRDFNDDTYIVQQMKKKAEEVPDVEPAVEHDQAAAGLDDQPVLAPLNSNGQFRNLRKEISDRQTGLASLDATIDKDFEELAKHSADIVKNLNPKNKPMRISLAQLKWFGLGAGVICIAYYLYSHKDKQPLITQ